MSEILLVRGARQLLTLRGPSGARRGPAMGELGLIQDGAMLVCDGKVAHIGPARRIENLAEARLAEEVDATGAVVMPGFVDSHTHMVFGAPRLAEYEMRIAGRGYREIAAEGGGILQSMRSVRAATSRGLAGQARKVAAQMARLGTTTVEVKSGYGLDCTNELKQLRAARSLDGDPLHVVPTFLGAHAVPPEFEGRPDAYIDSAIRDILPEVARKRLARYADAYCDAGAFSLDQARRFLEAAQRAGLGLRVHASQFQDLGAVELAVSMGAASVDHLEAASPRAVEALARSSTVAALLPASVAHLGLTRFAPARALIDAGAAVALATDMNPGTSPTPGMPAVLSLACSYMKMQPAEAITAATWNGACALELQNRAGSLEAGKPADFLILSVGDYRELPYYFGAGTVARTYIRGRLVARETEILS
jgi:imidazolonepropionase